MSVSMPGKNLFDDEDCDNVWPGEDIMNYSGLLK